MSSSVCVAEKKIKIGINGYGSLGKSIAIVIVVRKGVELVAINERYHHYFRMEPETKRGDYIVFGEKRVPYLHISNPEDIPWGEFGADVVVECTGLFTDKGKAAGHLKGGAKKVIISSPSEDAPIFVVGVNDHEYTSDLDVVSSGTSTINCLAPLAKVINDRFGIVEGLVTTIESINACQRTLIPRNSRVAKDVSEVIPSLNGKLAGVSFSYPQLDRTIDFSVADFTIRLDRAATYQDIKNAIKEESEGSMKEILGYTDDYVESTNFTDDTRSSIFDAKAGIALSDKFVKIVSRYDNKWGYISRVVDLIVSISSM